MEIILTISNLISNSQSVSQTNHLEQCAQLVRLFGVVECYNDLKSYDTKCNMLRHSV